MEFFKEGIIFNTAWDPEKKWAGVKDEEHEKKILELNRGFGYVKDGNIPTEIYNFENLDNQDRFEVAIHTPKRPKRFVEFSIAFLCSKRQIYCILLDITLLNKPDYYTVSKDNVFILDNFVQLKTNRHLIGIDGKVKKKIGMSNFNYINNSSILNIITDISKSNPKISRLLFYFKKIMEKKSYFEFKTDILPKKIEIENKIVEKMEILKNRFKKEEFLNILRESDSFSGKQGWYGKLLIGKNYSELENYDENVLKEYFNKVVLLSENFLPEAFNDIVSQYKNLGTGLISLILHFLYMKKYFYFGNSFLKFYKKINQNSDSSNNGEIFIEYCEDIKNIMEKFNIESNEIDWLLRKCSENKEGDMDDGKKDNIGNQIIESVSKPLESLNTILYGPPGTGKTYKVNQIKKKWEAENGIDSVYFVTFHQSYSYEEFVEGIKPQLDNEGNVTGEVKYIIEDGVFKEIADLAMQNYLESIKSNEIDYAQIVEKYFEYIDDTINEEETYNLTLKVKIKEILLDNKGEYKTFKLGGSVTSEQLLTKKLIMRDIEDYFKGIINKPDHIAPTRPSKQKRHGNAPYYFYVFEDIKKKIGEIKTENNTLRKYLLMIDEINRGNISKIFGELITLIEEDKRKGKDQEVTVTLPYSKEKFSVPPNLYILGTMNTADRSIALMDIALRRRFQFIEMLPDFSALEAKNDDNIKPAIQILKSINQKIRIILDKDHQLGQSFIYKCINKLNEEDEKFETSKFINVFYMEIIPTLREYFYEDWEKLLLVLGDKLVIEDKDAQEILDRNEKLRSYIYGDKIYKINQESLDLKAISDSISSMIKNEE